MLELPSTPSANQSKIVTDSTDSVTRRVIEGDSDMIITDITKAKNPTTLTAAKTLFYYHTGSVCGLAVASKSMCVTVGDDKQLMLWDASNCQLVSKTTLDVCSFEQHNVETLSVSYFFFNLSISATVESFEGLSHRQEQDLHRGRLYRWCHHTLPLDLP